MPFYNYECTKCGATFEELLPIDKRHEPQQRPCNSCNGAFIKNIISSPFISYEGKHDAFKRAGAGWKEVQDKIKKASGRENTIRSQ